MANDDDDLKAFEQREDRKWANLQRIQQRMAARQKQRVPPRQTEFAKKKKLKNIENPEWKAKFEKDRLETEKKIKEKYKEDMKRKKKLEKQKKEKQDKILKKKWEAEKKKNKSGLKEKPPDTRNWQKNLVKQQLATQREIDRKYELKKAQDNLDRAEFKKKAAEIEKKYDDKKPKKKKRDPNKRAIVINDEHNAWTAVENSDFTLLDRIYAYYPNDIKRKDKQGNTILHHAIKHHEKRRNNNAQIIEYLIPKLPVSFMNAVNYLGNTPMTLAVYDRKFECMKSLYSCSDIKRRPDLDSMNINGRTVLMRAAMRDDVEILEFLLKCHPPPTLDLYAEKHHKTALTFAVEHNKHDAVKILVENGANFYIKNKLGHTAYEMAKKKSLRYIIKQDRVNCVKGIVMSSLVRNLNFPDYLITIISQYVAEIPQHILDEERREKEEEEKKKKKKKKNRRNNGRARGRGRGRARRGRGGGGAG